MNRSQAIIRVLRHIPLNVTLVSAAIVVFIASAVPCGAVELVLADPAPALAASTPWTSDVATFEVVARRFFFSGRRAITASAHGSGDSGQLEIIFDEPFKPIFDIRELRFRLEITDADGHCLDSIVLSLREKTSDLSVPLNLPGAGTYFLVIREDAIEAPPARLALEPRRDVHIRVEVPGPKPLWDLPPTTVPPLRHAAQS